MARRVKLVGNELRYTGFASPAAGMTQAEFVELSKALSLCTKAAATDLLENGGIPILDISNKRIITGSAITAHKLREHGYPVREVKFSRKLTPLKA